MKAHFNGRQQSRLAGQRGFSMLEILITLFLLTMWMLASAGVQSASLQFNKAAVFRTQAVYFATDLAERMQANKTGATAGNYAYAGAALSAPTKNCMTDTDPCSPAALAELDLWELSTRVTAALPGGTVIVTPVTLGNPATYQIVVSWVDRRADRTYSATGDTESFSYTAAKTVFDSSTL